ncbi:MAG: hypothetical protein RIQ79_1554, partial [Verrucomicrobiota bacterium]
MLDFPHPCRASALSLALALSFVAPVRAAGLIGADTVLQRLAEAAKSEPATTADPVAELNARVRAFVRDSASLGPAQSAAQWIALYDAFALLPPESLYGQNTPDRLSFQLLIESLPDPVAWDALSASIRARTEGAKTPRDFGLRILGALLGADPAASLAVTDALSTAIAADKKLEDYERENLQESVKHISEALAALSGDADVLAAFARKLADLEKPDSSRGSSYESSIEVPDLVLRGGVEAAEPLLLRALRLDKELSVAGEGTRRLATKLALREI